MVHRGRSPRRPLHPFVAPKLPPLDARFANPGSARSISELNTVHGSVTRFCELGIPAVRRHGWSRRSQKPPPIPSAPSHSHRLNVSHGACPYAKPLLVKTGQGYDLIGVELAGMDFEDGNVVEWQPGAKPVVTIPPKPEVNLTPLPRLW